MAITQLLNNQHVILDTDARGWNYLVPQTDPTENDSDFYETWYHYDPTRRVDPPSGYAYNGPKFTSGAQTPIASDSSHSAMTDFPVKTLISSNTNQTSYFTTVIEGGQLGLLDINLRLVAAAGAVIYVDGQKLGWTETMDNLPDVWEQTTQESSGDFHEIINSLQFGQIDPGPHVLAISVHQKNNGNTVGLEVLLTGNPADGCDMHIIAGPYIDALGLTDNNEPELTMRLQTDGPCETIRFYIADSLNSLQTASGIDFQFDPNQIGNCYDFLISNDILAPIPFTLYPDSTYYYKLELKSANTDSSTSTVMEKKRSFTTPPLPGNFPASNRIRIWATGDTGNGWRSSQSATGKRPRSVFDAFRSVYKHGGKQDIFLLLGDDGYVSGNYDTTYQASIQDALFEMYQSLFQNTLLLSTRGNHDDNDYYFDPIFPASLLKTGELGGVRSDDALYYSFNYGPIHFICLDSWDYSDKNSTPAMHDWLEQDLQNTTQPWKIIFCHHSAYSFGHYNSDNPTGTNINGTIMMNMRRDFAPLWEQYGVDLVVAAHCHSYERSYFINGHYGGDKNEQGGTYDSCTFDPATMIVQEGNGSMLGSTDSGGNFVYYEKPDPSLAYIKNDNAGTVYIVEGGGSAAEGWSCPDYDPAADCEAYTGDCSSSDLVNLNPYPAMAVSLYLLGSIIIDVVQHPHCPENHTGIHVQKIDNYGILRDDFTILKQGE